MASSSKRSSFTSVQKYALEVLRREMRSYDLLSRPARIVYERAISRAIDSGALNPSYTCAHGVMLYDPCVKCERSEQDCKTYRDHAIYHLKELLAIIE